MNARRDDDALTWDGDDDPTLDASSTHPGFDDMPMDAAADEPATGTPADAAQTAATSVAAQPPGTAQAGQAGQAAHAAPLLPAGWTAVGPGSEEVREAGAGAGTEHPESDAQDAQSVQDAAAPGLGNAALISLGVFGGVFLLYAIGWYLGATRLAEFQMESGYGALIGIPVLSDDFMYLVWVALVTLAAPIWFVATIFLTKGARFWKRFVALLGGVVLLVPWPFLMIGAVAV